MSLTLEKMAASIPSEIMHYMKGATEENMQFDFLIGDWIVEGSKFTVNGDVQQYAGSWKAQYLHEKRMVMDDFTVYSPSGQEISAFITLRTFSPETKRWEMSGLAAFQPVMIKDWHGHFIDGQMHLEAKGCTPDGATVLTRIRFHDIQPDRFQWENQLSVDEGKTWMTNSMLQATRVGSRWWQAPVRGDTGNA